MEAKQKNRPFCITFCGVNGVGKSTNLAKVRTELSAFLCNVSWNKNEKKKYQGDDALSLCHKKFPEFLTSH